MTLDAASTADPAHILVVDDDKRIRALLTRFLIGEGYRVSAAADAQEATRRLRDLVFDLIVLDVMMPGESGLDFAARLRTGAAENAAPILMLTARSETSARIEGLEAGADDYLGKPFEPRELALRVASLLRRTRRASGGGKRSARFGGYRFDLDSGALMDGAAPIHLTTRERDLLRLLAQDGGVVSRRALAQRGDAAASERSVDVEIARLRRKMPAAAHALQTVRGRGYRLILDDATTSNPSGALA
jgi:two-component system phosphate regulon response regulator OmpR